MANIVLVHGAFADGSGWRAVHRLLIGRGHKVSVVQQPTASLEDDVAYAGRAIDAMAGPVVLVGHSYGGSVITVAGSDEKVAALVYVAAFLPDAGETTLQLASRPVADATPPPFLPPDAGFLMLDPARFAEAFAQDVDPDVAAFMAVAQVPWASAAAGAAITDPAWKKKPAWALVTTQDRMIPPATQTMMVERAKARTSEVAAGHAVYVSHPDVVAGVVEQACDGVKG